MKHWVALAALASVSCGYHVAGHSDLLPKTMRSIAIPAFANATTRYKLTDRLPEDLAREFITRTRYRIVADPNAADAVLQGTVLSYIAGATVIDNGRATAVDLHVYLQISLVERATGKVLFSRPAMDVRERYQVSVDPRQYFEESDAALERAGKAVAQHVVTSILENF